MRFNRQQRTILGITVTIFLLLCFTLILHGEEPTWIQYTEPLSGENSPTYTDVINRPAKTIWQNFLIEHDVNGFHNYSALTANMDIDMSSKLDVTTFETEHNADGTHTVPIPASTSDLSEGTNLYYTEGRVSSNTDVAANTAHRSTTTGNPHNLDAADVGAVSTTTFQIEHNTDGTHNFTIPDPSEYALTGDGTGTMAYASHSASTPSDFTILVMVDFHRAGVSEALVSKVETTYSENIIIFGKDSSDHLYLDLGMASSYASTLTCDTTQTSNDNPRLVGVSYNASVGEIVFLVDGQTSAAISVSPSFPSSISNEAFRLGEGLDGDIYFVSWSNSAILPASTWITPYGEGVSQCPDCERHYDMDETSGGVLYDRAGSSVDLSVDDDAVWTEKPQGY